MVSNRAKTKPLRCVTIDVEEYFHIEAAYGTVKREEWGEWPSRVEQNMDLLLEMLDKHQHKATFFVLGDVAKRQPNLVKRVADAGHEIASHGTNHDRLHRLDADSFREDLIASKQLLEEQSGQQVIGYRAPSFSVVPQTSWAIDVLANCGFEYDASIFPVRHPAYGVPTAPEKPFSVQGSPDGAKMLEVPPLTYTMGSKKLPVAGGGYFRLFPLLFMKRGLKQAAAANRPAILYFHPWEFDPGMPRMPLSRVGMIRTYTGLKSAAAKLDRILSQDARWMTMRDAMSEFKEFADQSDVFCLKSEI